MELGACRSPSPCSGGLQPYRGGARRSGPHPRTRGLTAGLFKRFPWTAGRDGEGGISYPVCYILRIIKVCDLVWYKRRGHPLLAPKVLVARRAWVLVTQNQNVPSGYKLA